MITDINAGITQQILYAPFGEVITEYNAYWHNEKMPDYMFNAKELDEENGMYYYEARYYAPPTFISRDPLFEKYLTLSPYAYCANNSLKYVDSDGRKIVFAKGVSENFKAQFTAAIKYINKNNIGGTAANLQKSKIVYTIAEGKFGENNFDSKTRTVTWNPENGAYNAETDVTMSPTTILNQEFGHAENYDNAIKSIATAKQYVEDTKTDLNNPYGSKEEESVIIGIEQKTAKAFGEIQEGQVTRRNHKSIYVKTESVTSNKIKEDVIIRAKKIDE
jgi:RHS repeat-associated protein